MPLPADVTTFSDTPQPSEANSYLPGFTPTTNLTLVSYDGAWPAAYARLAGLVTEALRERALAVEHVGSTAVPGLEAKPTIDIDLTVADNDDESAYVPVLERAGFALAIREPWWYGHRLLRHDKPSCNLHVWSPGCAEAARHVIFRDWLRERADERERYARAKRAALALVAESGGDSNAYNAHKQAVIREIYGRAFAALGLA